MSTIWRLSASRSSPPDWASSSPSGFAARLAGEGREHAHRLGEEGHVGPHLLLDGVEGAGPEGLGHLLAQLLLVAGEVLHRELEIARHQRLHAVAVEADELAQEGDRQQARAADLVLLLEDDLGQHRAGDVLAGLGVVDDEILALPDHAAEIVERHIGRGAGVVEPAVGVFLDDRRWLFARHDVLFQDGPSGTRPGARLLTAALSLSVSAAAENSKCKPSRPALHWGTEAGIALT